MTGTLELYVDVREEDRFRLKAGSRQPVAASEACTTRAAAKNGIESVRRSAPDSALLHQTV